MSNFTGTLALNADKVSLLRYFLIILLRLFYLKVKGIANFVTLAKAYQLH